MISLEGVGTLFAGSLRDKPDVNHEPKVFAALRRGVVQSAVPLRDGGRRYAYPGPGAPAAAVAMGRALGEDVSVYGLNSPYTPEAMAILKREGPKYQYDGRRRAVRRRSPRLVRRRARAVYCLI